MKKNKLKHLLKFGILFFGISLFIVACEKDDLKNESTTTNSRYKTDLLTQKQIISNKQVKEKLESISPSIKNKTGNSALREIYIEAHNFTIVTDSVKYVEDTYNNVHS